MKTTKIMTDLIKAVEKKKTTLCRYGIDDDYVYYTPDSNRMFKIYKPLFLIDLSKALPEQRPLLNIHDFFNDDNTDEARKSNELREIRDMRKTKTIVKIESDESHAWINAEYLKEFEPDCTFRISKPNYPVFVYEDGEVVGMILPIRIKEDLDND